jgi:4-amino-4-deoxy-L-arabinose transferase-like glycosyltransferase
MNHIDTYPPQPALNTKKYFWLFCIVHLLIWTIVPAIVRGSVPQDTLEGIVWGNQWQFGYDKHPPLAAWLSALATHIGGTVGWPVYLLAQILIVMTFWAVWRLAREFLPPLYALLSVLLLEGIMYYNLLSPKFNPGTLMTPVWALSILFSYFAIKQQKSWQWLLVGVITAVNIYTKYQAPLIILPLLAMLLVTAEGRKSFKTIWFYLSIILCVLLLLPHIQWSFAHNFEEITYGLNRTDQGNVSINVYHKILNHLWNPIDLALSQVGAIAGLIIMLIPFYKAERINLNINSFDRRFLLFAGLGPLTLTLLYSFITGDKIHGTWCTPYFSLFGILAICMLHPELNKANMKRFTLFFIVIFLLVPIGRYGGLLIGPYITHTAKAHAYMPGKNIADSLTAQWHERYHRKLNYVAGSHYLLAYISAYSKDKPIPYFDWNKKQSDWINEPEMRKQGAVFAWYITNATETSLPINIQKRFPQAIVIAPQTYKKLTGANVKPVIIGVAFLPPEKDKKHD